MNINLRTDACDPDQVESFLNGEMSIVQEREFTMHLNSCETCRHALERHAAEPEAWAEAETLLKPCDFGSVDDDDLTITFRNSQHPLQIQNVLDALGPTDDPAMLGRLGGYEISGVVGSGGMGVVLKAIDKSLDRVVAIKVLAPHLATSGAAKKRFAREAKAAAAVLHPNVIAIHSVSNDEALPFLVMPYVRGASLQKRLDNEGPLSLNEILRIGSQIASGLAAAHAQGLVHRDIKPANILLEDGIERVTITDFGLARAVDDATITHSGVIAGTPQYMSPEQARGEPVEQRSDLFSLGSVLYSICTGHPPFRAETTYGVMRRISDDEPKSIREINPDIPAWLCSIIAKLMAKRAADRFEIAQEVSQLLDGCLAHLQQPTSVPLPEGIPQSPAPLSNSRNSNRRRKTLLGALGGFGAAILAFFVFFATTTPPEIAGYWKEKHSENWGKVKLTKVQDGKYTGSFSGVISKEYPGVIELSWSRIERQYTGTWSEGEDRFGTISLYLTDKEIIGSFTTDPKSKINGATPKLMGFVWVSAPPDPPRPEYGPDTKFDDSNLKDSSPPRDAQAGASPGTSIPLTTGPNVYGPVFVREIDLFGKGQYDLLDVQSGNFVKAPSDVHKKLVEDIADPGFVAETAWISKYSEDWIDESGVDLLLNRRGLTLFNGHSYKITGEPQPGAKSAAKSDYLSQLPVSFDNFFAGDIGGRMSGLENMQRSFGFSGVRVTTFPCEKGDLFLFSVGKPKDKMNGILECLDKDEANNKIKIRYKLQQKITHSPPYDECHDKRLSIEELKVRSTHRCTQCHSFAKNVDRSNEMNEKQNLVPAEALKTFLNGSRMKFGPIIKREIDEGGKGDAKLTESSNKSGLNNLDLRTLAKTVNLKDLKDAAATAEKAKKLHAEGYELWSALKMDSAAINFEAVIKLDPQNTGAWGMLGNANLNAGNSKRAIEAFEALLIIEPKNFFALHGLGQSYFAERKYDEAEKYLLDLSVPNGRGIWVELATLYLIQGKFDEVEKCLQKSEDSGDSKVKRLLLTAAKEKKLSPELRARLEPPSMDYVKAWALMYDGRREESKKLFDNLLEKSPNDPKVLNGLGWFHLNGNQLEEAKSCFQKAIKADPDAAFSMNGLARILKSEGNTEEAIKLWVGMIKKNPSLCVGSYGQVDVNMELREYQKSIPLLEKIVKERPSDEKLKALVENAYRGYKEDESSENSTKAGGKVSPIKNGENSSNTDANEIDSKARARKSDELQLGKSDSKIVVDGQEKALKPAQSTQPVSEATEEKTNQKAGTLEAVEKTNSEPKEFTTPISVSGRALNTRGEPIAGAKIYVSAHNPAYRRLGETTSDKDGH